MLFHLTVRHEQLIRQRIQVTAGCWLWTGAKSEDGYGIIHVRPYGNIRAHRLVYETVHGCTLLPGYDLHHICQNILCVKPDHLEPLTRQAHAKLNSWARATHCKNGHAYDYQNTHWQRYKCGWSRKCRACGRNVAARIAARRKLAV